MLAFLLLLLSVSECSVIHQVHHRLSANQLLLKSGNIATYQLYRVKYDLARISIDSVGSGGLGDYQDTEYFGNVTLGSSNQQFIVILDTGTANFFVPGLSCAMCKGKHKLDTSKSMTFNWTGQSFHFKYETENAYGQYGIDTLKMGGNGEQQLIIPNQKFGVADQIPVTINDGHADGVLGLAFQSIATDGTTPPLVNGINQGLLDQPIFTVYFMTRSPFYDTTLESVGPGGQITYGGLDSVNCGPVIAYTPLSSATQWQFTMTGVGFASYKSMTKYQVISDTSYPYIAGPKAVLKAIEKEAGGADFSCFKAPVDSLDFYMGSHTYSVQPINYMSQDYFDWMKEGKGDCQMNFMPIESNGFGPQWIFGAPFIRQFCNIYDYARQQIGFADSLQYKTQAASNTYVLNFILDASSSDSTWYNQESNLVTDVANIFQLGIGSHKTRFTIGGMASGYIFGGNATKQSDISLAFSVIQSSNQHGKGIADLGNTLSQFAADSNSNYAEHEAPPFAIIVAGHPFGSTASDGVAAVKKKGFRLLAIDVSSDGSLLSSLAALVGSGNVCQTPLAQSQKCDQWLMHRVFEME